MLTPEVLILAAWMTLPLAATAVAAYLERRQR